MNHECDHFGFYMAFPPVPIQLPGGALLVTAVVCTNCGEVEYRSPPIRKEDELELTRRMRENEKINELVRPLRERERVQ